MRCDYKTKHYGQFTVTAIKVGGKRHRTQTIFGSSRSLRQRHRRPLHQNSSRHKKPSDSDLVLNCLNKEALERRGNAECTHSPLVPSQPHVVLGDLVERRTDGSLQRCRAPLPAFTCNYYSRVSQDITYQRHGLPMQTNAKFTPHFHMWKGPCPSGKPLT